MQSMSEPGVLRRQIRHRICARCHRRRPAKRANQELVRPCERMCRIFQALPMLHRTALLIDPMLSSRRDALGHLITDICARNSTKTSRKPGDDPLVHYREAVVETVLRVVGEM